MTFTTIWEIKRLQIMRGVKSQNYGVKGYTVIVCTKSSLRKMYKPLIMKCYLKSINYLFLVVNGGSLMFPFDPEKQMNFSCSPRLSVPLTLIGFI